MNGKCWIEPIVKEDSMEMLKPLIIPSKGKAVRVYPWNKTLLRNTLVLHEKKQAEIKNDTLYVEGKPVQHCHFTKDYYWVSANNTINLSDSRLFGFVLASDRKVTETGSSLTYAINNIYDMAGYGKEWNDKQMKE